MRLRELRAVTGISRAELERRAGLTANRLKIYEDGNRSQNVMDLKTAVAISNVLKIKPEDLIDDV